MPFLVESHTFDWRPNYPLVVCAKRYQYTDGFSDPPVPNDGYTAILAHGTGFHGEQWEPTLERLFELSRGHGREPEPEQYSDSSGSALAFREAWSVECPNHGDGAVLNDAVLQRGVMILFSWSEYAHILYLFLADNPNPRLNFTVGGHKLIGIGHSMGAISLCLTQTYPHSPRFSHLVLCEPMLAPTDITNTDPMMRVSQTLVSATETRRDVWPSLEDASKYLRSRRSFKKWDEQVLEAYLKYGFRPLPTSTYPDKEGVTLKCTKVQEAACYRDGVSSRRIYDFLPMLCARVPVHVIWGAIDDALDRRIKDRVTDANTGRKMASVTRVEGAGHLVSERMI
ncbi:Alpha/beta hydrolase fold-1 [Gautieria morchelliformis]|nr:Alpha/beta hydrolase fold-1 [Gautieria morchelliformis]